MKKILARILIPVACVLVMILTSLLIGVFYIATFIRRLFVKDFLTNAQRQAMAAEENYMGSATAQMHAIQHKLEKGNISQPKPEAS